MRSTKQISDQVLLETLAEVLAGLAVPAAKPQTLGMAYEPWRLLKRQVVNFTGCGNYPAVADYERFLRARLDNGSVEGCMARHPAGRGRKPVMTP